MAYFEIDAVCSWHPCNASISQFHVVSQGSLAHGVAVKNTALPLALPLSASLSQDIFKTCNRAHHVSILPTHKIQELTVKFNIQSVTSPDHVILIEFRKKTSNQHFIPTCCKPKGIQRC